MGEKALCLLIGYLFGCILTAELIVKHKTGKSVSEFGTGNPGMANVMRIFGFRTGAAVLAGDLAKTVAAVLICCVLFGRSSILPSGKPLGQYAVLWAGLGAALGHNWPVWRRMRGGKGVAVTCMTIFLFSPLWGLISDAAGMLVVFRTGYLPLGAVVITTLFTVFAGIFYGAEAAIPAFALALIMLSRHYPGLIRSFKGTEEKNAQYLKKNS
ncbi:MAG: glycerol-3-phosphate acyltransferase [Lachnospiraceae bacterium]|nr:glycerol-3-phosphate acyltransferase [Lachnospiraceae bacterium]